jgi:hypothetical protein
MPAGARHSLPRLTQTRHGIVDAANNFDWILYCILACWRTVSSNFASSAESSTINMSPVQAATNSTPHRAPPPNLSTVSQSNNRTYSKHAYFPRGASFWFQDCHVREIPKRSAPSTLCSRTPTKAFIAASYGRPAHKVLARFFIGRDNISRGGLLKSVRGWLMRSRVRQRRVSKKLKGKLCFTQLGQYFSFCGRWER